MQRFYSFHSSSIVKRVRADFCPQRWPPFLAKNVFTQFRPSISQNGVGLLVPRTHRNRWSSSLGLRTFVFYSALRQFRYSVPNLTNFRSIAITIAILPGIRENGPKCLFDSSVGSTRAEEWMVFAREKNRTQPSFTRFNFILIFRYSIVARYSKQKLTRK